ncbi:MAG: hypothetical protein ABIU20_06615 [Blastocatellia bacterium]
MNQPNTFEITEADMPTLENAVAEALRQLRQSNDEYEARKPIIEARSAETDALLEKIKENLDYVEEYLRTPLTGFHLQ